MRRSCVVLCAEWCTYRFADQTQRAVARLQRVGQSLGQHTRHAFHARHHATVLLHGLAYQIAGLISLPAPLLAHLRRECRINQTKAL